MVTINSAPIERAGAIFLSEGFARMLAEGRIKSRAHRLPAGPDIDLDRLADEIGLQPKMLSFFLAFMMAWDRSQALIDQAAANGSRN